MNATQDASLLPRWRGFWLATGAGLLLVIMYLALIPVPQVTPPVAMFDKIIHFVVFCGLMVWFAALYPRSRGLHVFAALLVYGVMMELLQLSLSNRHAELADLLADAGGLLTGLLLARTALGRWPLWAERLAGKR